MARKRFNLTERTVIKEAMDAEYGLRVEWQNVTQWHQGMLAGDGEIITESDGWQHVEVVNLTTTQTISAGQVVYVSPGHIRAIQTDSLAKASVAAISGGFPAFAQALNGATAMSDTTTDTTTDSNPAQDHTTVGDLTDDTNAPTAYEKAGGAPASDDNASDEQNGHHGYGKRKFDQGFKAGQDSLRMDVRAVLNDMGSDTTTDDLAQAIADAMGLDFEPAAE